MNPPWWGIPVLVVVGVAVIVAGWWWDRRRQRAASEGFTTEDDLTAHPAPPTLPDADLAELLAARGPEPTLPAGLADRAFLSPARGIAAARNPLVVVTDVELEDERLILPLLDSAHVTRSPLVLVAPRFGFGLLGTLRANLLTGRVATLPVELSDPDLLAEAAALCGTVVVPDADLRSGWWPDSHRGTCAAWIADLDDSWVTPSTSA